MLTPLFLVAITVYKVAPQLDPRVTRVLRNLEKAIKLERDAKNADTEIKFGKLVARIGEAKMHERSVR